jgi:DNA-binding Lrp family transcriptional regulator
MASRNPLHPKRKRATPGPDAEPLLDSTDGRILAALCEDGRLSMRTLADQVGISRAGAYARVERLRNEGVIAGFTSRLDPARVGLRVAALIIVTLNQDSWRAAVSRFRAMPEVAYCAITAAEFDAVLIVRAPDVDAVRDVILGRLHEMPEVRRTRTMLVLDEFVGTDADLLRAAMPRSD